MRKPSPLAQRLIDRGRSVRDFAAQNGVTAQNISMHLRGGYQKMPQWKLFIALCKALGMSGTELESALQRAKRAYKRERR